jgi:hypothetical protein
MSRIATLVAVVTMVVAPAALARPFHPVDLRAVQSVDPATPAQVDLRSPDAATPVQFSAQQDLRSPDAATPVVSPAADPHAAPSGDGFNWGIAGVCIAALAACGVLTVMVRRHTHVRPSLGA